MYCNPTPGIRTEYERPAAVPRAMMFIGCRGTISRVMSWVIICLDLPLPAGSSNQPVTGRAALRHVSVLLRMGFTCARPVTVPAVVSYTALPPLPYVIRRYPLRVWDCGSLYYNILPSVECRCVIRNPPTTWVPPYDIWRYISVALPWSRLHRTLSGILPCEARTFLTFFLSEIVPAIICSTQINNLNTL